MWPLQKRPVCVWARRVRLPLMSSSAPVSPIFGQQVRWLKYSICHYKHHTYIPLATTANKQGRVAGTNAAGGLARFGGVVGTAVVKAFDLTIALTGLTEKYALAHGLAADSVTIEASSRAHYMPGSEPIHVKLVYEKNSQRVLGAQMIGKDGVAKRIDVVAAALKSAWTLRDFADLDLAYAPPFAPVWDPLLVAANVAIGKAAKD